MMNNHSETAAEMRWGAYLLTAVFVLTAAVSVSFSAGLWWGKSNMQIICLLLGEYGDIDERRIAAADNLPLDDNERIHIITRYEEHNTCAEVGFTKSAEHIAYLAEERGWAEAQYIMATKLKRGGGGGGFLYSNLYRLDITEKLLFDDAPATTGDKRAYRYLRQSAEQGYPPAQGVMSYLYRSGNWGAIRVNRDMDESMRWLNEYAKNEDGHGAAGLFFIGKRHLRGYPGELEQDYGRALEYIRQSADQSFVPAMATLSLIYACADGWKDSDKARQWRERTRDEIVNSELPEDFIPPDWKEYIFQDAVAADDCHLLRQ